MSKKEIFISRHIFLLLVQLKISAVVHLLPTATDDFGINVNQIIDRVDR